MIVNNEYFEKMLNNFINGNLSDYKKQLKGLTKIELLRYIRYVYNNSGYSVEKTITRIIALLEN